jgi:mannose/fructose/N-acetylgalactosamine-specific phosphotransferase system component IID
MNHAQTLMTFLPLAVIGLILWALAKWAAPAWALLLALILGVVLSGTIAGPSIHQFLSQISGGRLQ